MSFVQRLVLGLAASAAIGWVAYRRQTPARSGVIGAVLAGEIGDTLHVGTDEMVSYHHMAVGFVRGKWRRRDGADRAG